MEKDMCLHEGREFSRGAQMCDDKKCFVCENGSWEERFIDRVFGVGP
ncbi:MAG: hypothetical protein LLG06_14680 [Desulfobacteraceae bacterium]|nr:hypothetical protein [Desulfobacteraceae bacterium]